MNTRRMNERRRELMRKRNGLPIIVKVNGKWRVINGWRSANINAIRWCQQMNFKIAMERRDKHIPF